MPTLKRYIPLLLIGLFSACIDVPDIEYPADSGTTLPDSGIEDTENPKLTRSTPAPGTTGIPVSTGLEFDFSEPMSLDTVHVSINPQVALGMPMWSAGGMRLNLQPSASLAQSTIYTVAVSGRDVAGNELTGSRSFSFTTAAVDTERPSIARSTPANGATQVALDSALELEFSEPMSTNSVQVSISPTVTLGVPTWFPGNTRLVFQPSTSLAENVTYTVTVEAGLDAAGNELTGTRTFSFTTTGPALDTTPPTAIASVPSNMEIGVERTASITVLFSEPMDKASVQSAFAITSPAGFTSGVFTWNTAGTQMTFKPNTNFGYGVEVSWAVNGSAKDASGNALQPSIAATFHTLRTNTVFINFDLYTSGSIQKPAYYAQRYPEMSPSVGDDAADHGSRMFFGFKLDPLPENLARITSSSLTWWISAKQGDPFGQLGSLLLESVDIGEQLNTSSIVEGPTPEADADFNAQAQGSPINVNNNIHQTHGQFDVTSFVINDWDNRTARNSRSQFRLRFTTETNSNGTRDSLYSEANTAPKFAELEVTYEYP